MNVGRTTRLGYFPLHQGKPRNAGFLQFPKNGEALDPCGVRPALAAITENSGSRRTG